MKKNKIIIEIKYGAKIMIGLLIPLIGVLFSVIIYAYTFSFINMVDPSIYSLYASDGVYEVNPYFSSEIDKLTGVYQTLVDNFDIKTATDARNLHKLKGYTHWGNVINLRIQKLEIKF